MLFRSDATEILTTSVSDELKDSIGIRHASFTWAADTPTVAVTPGGTRRRTFVLGIDDEVFFKRGKINLIIGPTGAGKTSLLMALLGEMHYIPQGPDSFVNLPRTGGVAYAAQESWVQSDTIKVCRCCHCAVLGVVLNDGYRTILCLVPPSTRFGTTRVGSSCLGYLTMLIFGFLNSTRSVRLETRPRTF